MNIRVTDNNKYEFDDRHIHWEDTRQTSRGLQFYLLTLTRPLGIISHWFPKQDAGGKRLYNRPSVCLSQCPLCDYGCNPHIVRTSVQITLLPRNCLNWYFMF